MTTAAGQAGATGGRTPEDVRRTLVQQISAGRLRPGQRLRAERPPPAGTGGSPGPLRPGPGGRGPALDGADPSPPGSGAYPGIGLLPGILVLDNQERNGEEPSAQAAHGQAGRCVRVGYDAIMAAGGPAG